MSDPAGIVGVIGKLQDWRENGESLLVRTS